MARKQHYYTGRRNAADQANVEANIETYTDKFAKWAPKGTQSVGSIPGRVKENEMSTKFNINTLGDIADKRTLEMIQRQIQVAIDDCMDRGQDKKSREVVLKIGFQLKKGEEGEEDVNIRVTSHTVIPPAFTITLARPQRNKEGRTILWFNSKNPLQRPLPFEGEATA
jgi:hypothetical protein